MKPKKEYAPGTTFAIRSDRPHTRLENQVWISRPSIVDKMIHVNAPVRTTTDSREFALSMLHGARWSWPTMTWLLVVIPPKVTKADRAQGRDVIDRIERISGTHATGLIEAEVAKRVAAEVLAAVDKERCAIDRVLGAASYAPDHTVRGLVRSRIGKPAGAP